jgi:hypothetical protein
MKDNKFHDVCRNVKVIGNRLPDFSVPDCKSVYDEEFGSVYFPDHTLHHQKNNNNNMAQDLRKQFADEGYPIKFHVMEWFPKIYRASNVYISKNGVITEANFKFYATGSCSGMHQKHLGDKVSTGYLLDNSIIHDNVISITGYWAGGTWHFVAESLTALMFYSEWNPEYKLQISKKNKWNMQWLELLPYKIPDDNIIDYDCFARNAFFPEQSLCGDPGPERIYFLRNIVNEALKKDKILDHESFRTFVLVKRKVRALANFKEVYDECKRYCDKNSISLVIHDDTKLPSLIEQLTIFREAEIVVMPHGAGGVLNLACDKGTHVIEFLNEVCPMCFVKLSYFLGLKHYCLTASNHVADVTALHQTLVKIEKMRNI